MLQPGKQRQGLITPICEECVEVDSLFGGIYGLRIVINSQIKVFRSESSVACLPMLFDGRSHGNAALRNANSEAANRKRAQMMSTRQGDYPASRLSP